MWEFGFPPGYIERKVREVKETLGFEPEKIIVGYDYSGPCANPKDASMFPYPGVANAIGLLGSRKCIISGWDSATLEFVKKEFLKEKMDTICQLGDMVEINNQTFITQPMSTPELIKMEKEIFDQASVENLKLAIQGNLPVGEKESTRVHCFYLEGDGEKRGNLLEHPLVKRREPYTPRELEKFLNENGVKAEFTGDSVIIEDFGSYESIKALDEFFREHYPLNSFRLSERGEGKVEVERDLKDKNITLEYVEEFFKEICGKGWKIELNPDFCCDVIYKGDEKSVSKQKGIKRYVERVAGNENYLLTIVGDKPGDMLDMPNAFNFPQYGTKAHEHCVENDLPHSPVINAIDYSFILHEIEKQAKVSD